MGLLYAFLADAMRSLRADSFATCSAVRLVVVGWTLMTCVIVVLRPTSAIRWFGMIVPGVREYMSSGPFSPTLHPSTHIERATLRWPFYFLSGGGNRIRVLHGYNTDSKPLRSIRLSSLSDGPLGFFSPISHFCTVDTLVLRIAAKTA